MSDPATTNNPLTVFEGEMTINPNGANPIECLGVVQWRWLPSPYLFLEAQSQNVADTHDAFISEANEVQVPGVEVLRFSPTNFTVGDKLQISGRLLGTYCSIETPALQRLTFSLPNFPDFYGLPIITEPTATTGKAVRMGRMLLRAAGWQVTLDNFQNTKEIIKVLHANGGYAITHAGIIERVDGALFTIEEVEDFMEYLSFFFAFVAGRWTQPVLWMGNPGMEHPIFPIIKSSPRLDSWEQINSWASAYGMYFNKDISEFFPRFIGKFIQERELLRLGISWYLEALSRKLVSDSRIVLTQSALELLAMALPPLIGYRAKGKAEHRLRDLITNLVPSVPQSVPSGLTRLTEILSEAPATNWNRGSTGVADGPSTLVSIRNLIAHPAREEAEKKLLRNVMALYEVSQLGLWYLELILLSWLGYSGHYHPRIILKGWLDQGEVFPSLNLLSAPK